MTAENIHQEIREHLLQLEAELQVQKLWSAVAPDPKALESTTPFMYDTLKLHEWLQWVFIPRLRAVIDAKGGLPTKAMSIRWPTTSGSSAPTLTSSICCACSTASMPRSTAAI
jgi:uncharacterized protein YqcC (DUF446 family)